jgi:hypothetical protein
MSLIFTYLKEIDMKIKRGAIIFPIFIILNLIYSDPLPNNWDGSDIEAKNDIAKRILDGDIGYLKYDLDYLSIGSLTYDEMNMLMNMIYAKYGFIFKETSMTEYFKKYPWYKPINISVEKMFTKTDILNIKVINKFISINEKIDPLMDDKYMTGVWMQSPLWYAPSGFPRRFFFYPDGSFVFKYSQGRFYGIADSFKGKYRISGNCMIIEITEKIFFKMPKQDDIYVHHDVRKVVENCDLILKLPVVKKEPFINLYYDPKEKTSESNWKFCECVEIGGESFFRWFNDPNWQGDK